jgi:hypothetical protein
MSGNVNATLTADIAAFQAAMNQAAQAAQSFAAGVTASQAQAQAAFNATGAAATRAGAAVTHGATAAGTAAGGLASKIGGLGISADLAARKLSAMLDETLAGRWRQFDGTLASVVTKMLAANAALGGMVVAAGAAAGAVAYLAYEWIATTNAIKVTANEMVIMGTAGTDAIERINASIKHSREELDLWPGETRDVERALGNLPPAAEQFRTKIQDLGVEFAKLNKQDVGKTTEKLVEVFAKGSKATEEWANKYHLLDNQTTASGQSLKQYVADAAAAGHDQAVFDAVIQAAARRFGEYGRAIINADIALRQWMRDQAMLGEGGAPLAPMPELPKMPDLKLDPQIQQEQNAVDKLNVGLNKRRQLTMELEDAKAALNRAQKDGNEAAIAAATEAVATAEQKLNEVHLTTETVAHRAKQAEIDLAEATAKTAKDKVEIARRNLAETLAYYHEGSAEAVAAVHKVAEAEHAAATESYRIQSLKYEQQIVDAKGNVSKQKAIYEQWLADTKALYDVDSTQYQSVLLKREELLHRHTAAGVDMTKEGLRQQIAAADGNYKEQLALEDQLLAYLKQKYGERSKQYQAEALKRIEIANREAKQEAAIAADAARTQEAITRSVDRMAARLRSFQTGGTKFSLLDLLGFSSADTSAFEEQLNQVKESHEEAMTAIKKQQEDAVNPRSMAAALDAEKKEMQSFAEETQKIQLQEATAVKRAWQSVSDSIATELGTSITKMVTGQQSAMRSIGSVIEATMNKIITWSLKMLGHWIIDRLKEVTATSTAEAGKTAATAAGTTARTGIQAAATSKETGGFLFRLFKWIATELGMTGATTAGTATRTTEQSGADAETAMATSTTDVARAESQVGVAATGAAASVAAIPIAGAAAAPAAAASTVAALQPYVAMAAMDVGAWNVPRDMVAQIHKNEMVVPADFASGLRGQLQGTGPHNPIALNFQPNISMTGNTGLSRNSVQNIMAHASQQMYGYMRNVYRNGTVMLPGSRMG